MAPLPITEKRQPDGRHVYLFGAWTAAPVSYSAPAIGEGAYERRWNPLRQEWVLVAAARQQRTFLPEDASCPLCPSTPNHSTEIPAGRFDAAVFENRFPAMRSTEAMVRAGGAPKRSPQASSGACEVVVYTDRHHGSFSGLGARDLGRLLWVWTHRYRDLASRPEVRYVYIFENRGEAVGVTLQHPHGQIYGYPFIPPVVEMELRAGRAHIRAGKGCLQCALIDAERTSGERILFERRDMVAYVPAYARWPYEVHIATVDHLGALPDLPADAHKALGEALQRVAQAYDRLFGLPMPYMMVMHQRPTDGRPHPEAHLHAEFYPVLRGPGRRKYLAAGECGAGTFVAEGVPEEKAAELRRALQPARKPA